MRKNDGSIFASENAYEQGEPNFDKRVKAIQDNPPEEDDVSSKQVRLKEWMEHMNTRVAIHHNTSNKRVSIAGYTEGLKVLTHHIPKDDRDLIRKLIMQGDEIAKGYENSIDGIEASRVMLNNTTIQSPFYGRGETTGPKWLHARASEMAQVEREFVDQANFGPWIHSAIMIIGVATSEAVTQGRASKANRMRDYIVDQFDEMIEAYQRSFYEYISVNIQYWRMNGIDGDVIEDMWDIQSSIRGDMADLVAGTLELIEENCEIR